MKFFENKKFGTVDGQHHVCVYILFFEIAKNIKYSSCKYIHIQLDIGYLYIPVMRLTIIRYRSR